ncbi:MAG TPA: DUF2807 domain-containing protein [Gaiellaceae bacterium]
MTIAHRRVAGIGAGLVALFLAILVLLVIVLIADSVFGSSSSTSGTAGSGRAVAQTRTVGPFRDVELAGSLVVNVGIGSPSVVVHADDNLVGRVTTRVLHDRLVVGTTNGDFRANAPTYVDVTVPAVSTVALTGSGMLTLTGIAQRELTVLVPGSGLVRASGRVDTLTVSMPGSGDAELRGLVAKKAHATLAGSGTIAVTATDTLDGNVGGSGAILYAGNPLHVTTSVTGTGAITPS